MNMDRYRDSSHYRRVYEQIETLGLVEHIKHLDEFGYVVIPPDLVAPESFQQRLRQAGLDVHERRTGEKIHIDEIATARLAKDGPGFGHGNVLADDPAFQETVLNPTVLALGRYLCGNSAVLSDVLFSIKQKDSTLTHPLHTDQHGTPPPLPPYAQVANVTWAMTEYTRDNGPVAIVPGSHRKSRYPSLEEGNFARRRTRQGDPRGGGRRLVDRVARCHLAWRVSPAIRRSAAQFDCGVHPRVHEADP